MHTVEIISKVIDGTGVIYPGQYLNQLRGELIEERCHEMLAVGVRRIVINFEETELVNSIGISILLGVIEAVNEVSGELILSNLNDSNRELFDMLGLFAYVGVEITEESALRKLHEQPELVTSR
ncbi:MAG: STAS domain-containing protein [Blastocatellia bacterium]|nr:STAS domain-containing protein [Blastocatellia bacterium]